MEDHTSRYDEANLQDMGPTKLKLDDIDNLKTLTDTKLIEIASGDIVNHIKFEELALNALGQKAGSYYRDLIFALVQIRLPEDEAKRDWKEILKHKYIMSEMLKRNVGIHVATLDYYTNIKKKMTSPKIVDAREYLDTANRAITDELTKAYNRHFFDDEFRRNFMSARVSHEMFGLLMLDLDHFKIYNDVNGHIQGDIALIETVRVLHAVCSREDIVARYGGEEFAVLVAGKGIDETEKVAENVRQAIYDYRFVNEQRLPEGRLSASVGVTSYRDDIKSPIDMIEEADVALYRAKNGGRNRVKVFLNGAEQQPQQ
jgi:diguanylate cyclase (GGDEF)-like protein